MFLRLSALVLTLSFPLLAWGCQDPDDPSRIVGEAIRTHGGDTFEESTITFDFRNTRFRVERDGGRFRYERTYTDPEGVRVVEALTNEGISMEVEGASIPLTPQDRARIETAVNSVVYFGFLPFLLDDPSVRLRKLDDAEVEGEPYRKVEVTFQEEGGGQDWEDRFVYWFHRDRNTLDFMAYRYYRDGGGMRFRRAVNRREVGGILIQDYENMTGEVQDIAAYDRLLEEDMLVTVSMIELENVQVEPSGR